MRAGRLADETARRLHGLLSKERDKRGLRKLSGRQGLINSAESYARTMAHKGHIGHHVDGTSPRQRAPSRYTHIAENVAKVHGRRGPGALARQFRDQWMQSPGHRKNILNETLRYDGIGIWIDGSEIYAVHLMAGSQTPLHAIASIPVRLGKFTRSAIDVAYATLTPGYSLRERQLVFGGILGLLTTVVLSLLHSGVPFYELTIGKVFAGLWAYSGSVLSYFPSIRSIGGMWLVEVAWRIQQYFVVGGGLILAAGSILVSEAVSDTGRFRYVLVNSASVLVGYYLVFGLYFTWSGTGTPERYLAIIATGLLGSLLGGILLWTARKMRHLS